jgi:hypothetical protein
MNPWWGALAAMRDVAIIIAVAYWVLKKEGRT